MYVHTHADIYTIVNLFVVHVQFLEGVDGDEDVTHVGVDEPLLVALPQLRHQHTLRWGEVITGIASNYTLANGTAEEVKACRLYCLLEFRADIYMYYCS